MAELRISDIPQAELDAFTARARRHGRTAEQEALHLIHEAAAEEQLVQQLEEAARAEETVRAAESALPTAPAPAAVAATPRRRYRTHEPTPRRR